MRTSDLPRETVEPGVVVLTDAEQAILSRIVEARVEKGMGKADSVRRYTVREFVLAGLCDVARAEGVGL
jgi:hypothetical protein